MRGQTKRVNFTGEALKGWFGAMFRMLSCGYHFVHEDGITINRPQGTGFYVFVLHLSEAEALLAGERTALGSGTCVLYGPRTLQYYRELEKPFVNDWVHFQGEGLADFFRSLSLPIGRAIAVPRVSSLSRCIHDLQDIQSQGGSLCERMLDVSLQKMFLTLCNKGMAASAPEKGGRYFAEFSALRNSFYSAPKAGVSVGELAEKVHLSKSYFQHVYRELFGHAVMDDIIGGRLERAKYLLEYSPFPVSAIAHTCGYQNDTHFMRQFKKATGLTPSEYRKYNIK